MNINPLTQRIDARSMLNLQRSQYEEMLIISDTVPATSPKLGKLSVASLGHFYCQRITGSFTTMGAGQVDTGLSYLSVQIKDSTGNRLLTNDRVPLDLILTPGRRKSVASATPEDDPDSNSLFYPLEFVYLFTKNTNIFFDAYNSSPVANSYEIVMQGYRIIDNPTVSSAPDQDQQFVVPQQAGPFMPRQAYYRG